MLSGGCHCGAIRYEAPGEPAHSALCHCKDCRTSAGAPMVGWALYPQEAVTISGTPVEYRSSDHGRRLFCGTCGSGLFYTNEAIFPGQIDIQTGTLDNISALPPQAHIQMAEAADWMATAHLLPKFERFPGE